MTKTATPYMTKRSPSASPSGLDGHANLIDRIGCSKAGSPPFEAGTAPILSPSGCLPALQWRSSVATLR